MFSFSWTNIIFVLFFGYLANSVYVFYILFNPEECNVRKEGSKRCIEPSYKLEDLSKLKITIFTSRSSIPKHSEMKFLWDSSAENLDKPIEKLLNISIPYSTRKNGSLFAYIFLHPSDKLPFDSDTSQIVYRKHQLTKYAIPRDKFFNLIEGTNKQTSPITPITHMHTKMACYMAVQNRTFQRYSIPYDLYHLLNINQKGRYLPLLHVDGLSTLERHMVPITKNTSEVSVEFYFTPVSLGRMRIWTTVESTLGNLISLGFTDKDIDEVKGIFTDTNLYFLGMTFFVALVHMLFDVLAFKHDVSFWKKKQSMAGMSTRTVIWRCVSTTIIFFYLMDEKTSMLVLVPAGIGAIIEMWKVSKALKVKISFSSWKPSIKFGEKSNSEKQTEEFDEQAMKYLSYALYPLLLAAAAYSLIYQPHKSWYSWVVRSLVNGVYAFGFLFMLPQLFVNYKLKSVAHLPWKAFMYKAFNTFIDDIFAFIITMPTAHRLACFRDDIVFLVYLYQRWLYPVDKTRTNEYGMSFESADDKDNQIKNKTENEIETPASDVSLGDKDESTTNRNKQKQNENDSKNKNEVKEETKKDR